MSRASLKFRFLVIALGDLWFLRAFGAAMGLFVLTSAVAMPFVLFDGIRGRRRR